MNAPASFHAAAPLHPKGGRILADLTQAQPEPVASALSAVRRKRADRDEQLRALFAEGLDDGAIGAALGCSRQTVFNHRRALGLLRPKGRRAGSTAAAVARSRHEPKALDDKIARMPPVNHPALVEARTIYPRSVVPVSGLLNALVRGENSWKIGGTVAKGRWRGFPIYTLTLQERATCPTSCAHWRSCYGNAMNWAKRIEHGPALEARLGFEIGLLSQRHPAGFAVRLHVLGDFYSVAYVALWRALLDRHPTLRVFGFTARIDRHDPITAALVALVADHGPRCALRFSNAPIDTHATVSIEHPLQNPADAIVCPQQTGRTASCATCALCWSTDRRIAFLRH